MTMAEALRVAKRRPGASGGSATGTRPPRCAVSPPTGLEGYGKALGLHKSQDTRCSADVQPFSRQHRYRCVTMMAAGETHPNRPKQCGSRPMALHCSSAQ